MSGVVDWEAASIGPRSIDVAHCRINLLYDDLSRAEVFRHEWEQVSGQAFDPWADIVTVIGLLDGYRKHRPAQRARYASRKCSTAHSPISACSSANPSRDADAPFGALSLAALGAYFCAARSVSRTGSARCVAGRRLLGATASLAGSGGLR